MYVYIHVMYESYVHHVHGKVLWYNYRVPWYFGDAFFNIFLGWWGLEI